MLNIIEIIMLGAILWVLYTQKSGAGMKLFAKHRKLILDSCALIDGRIVEIVRAGFVADELIVPQFILNELQMLADGNDSHKRERARYGLDIAHELQDSAPMRVTIDRTVLPDIPTTDDKLVELAKKLNAQLYTTDYNLSKVAAVEGVQVLNVNELAQALRPITLPGETLTIKVIQKGSNRDQGVGYLDDGTMIVIEGGARFVGREMPVTVTRMHQTVAGKMVFGQVREREQPQQQSRHTETAASAAAAGRPNHPQQGTRSSHASAADAPVPHPEKRQGHIIAQAKNKLHARLTLPRRPSAR
ncbi:MAG: TRAM domain-containing protein [Candidatus Saccharimonadales bacterium]